MIAMYLNNDKTYHICLYELSVLKLNYNSISDGITLYPILFVISYREYILYLNHLEVKQSFWSFKGGTKIVSYHPAAISNWNLIF